MLFDAGRDARPVFKERLLWLLFLAPFFFLVYGTANQLSALHGAVPSIMFDWEKGIPFIPEMIVPYMSVDLLFGFSFLLPQSRDQLQRHALRLGFVIAASSLIFLYFPLHFSLDKPEVSGWTKPIFAALAADLPYNQLPSLHVSLAMVVGFQYYQYFKGVLRWAFVVWFVLIALSILFVYQHHFIDLPTGVLAGLFTFYLIPVRRCSRIALNFISPKHVHTGWYYLLASFGLTLLAFKSSMAVLTFVLGWAAFSLLFVASCYALAYNPLTHKKQGRILWPYWLIFWPYLLGNRLSWMIWKRKVPCLVRVVDGVWIGRSLDENDATLMQQHQIQHIIDLAPEISDALPAGVTGHYMPLLDLAIPDPILLGEICDKISRLKAQGNVMIHCKFGLSRSVMVACAWLMSQGYSQQQAWQVVSQAQQKHVDKPYLQIALALFAASLDKNADEKNINNINNASHG